MKKLIIGMAVFATVLSVMGLHTFKTNVADPGGGRKSVSLAADPGGGRVFAADPGGGRKMFAADPGGGRR